MVRDMRTEKKVVGFLQRLTLAHETKTPKSTYKKNNICDLEKKNFWKLNTCTNKTNNPHI